MVIYINRHMDQLFPHYPVEIAAEELLCTARSILIKSINK